jgi:hypothetical protein
MLTTPEMPGFLDTPARRTLLSGPRQERRRRDAMGA